MINHTIIRIFERIPRFLIYLCVIYLLAVLALSFLIDIQNMTIPEVSEWLDSQGGPVPLFWFHAFKDASPTEYIQWSLLGLSIMCAAIFGGIQQKTTSKFPWIWILLFLGLTFMLIEDVTDFRHYVGSFFAEYVFFVDHTAFSWQIGPWKSLIEIVLYALLGGMMILALLFILRDKKLSVSGKKMLAAGYVFYGVAAASSATRHLGQWYVKTGDAILERINSGMIRQVEDSFHQEYLGYHLMDFVVEESLELLGAAFIAAALMTFIALKLKKYKGKGRRYPASS